MMLMAFIEHPQRVTYFAKCLTTDTYLVFIITQQSIISTLFKAP